MAGRNRTTESTRRKHLLAFRWTDAELALLEKWAAADDLPLADFIRRTMTEYLMRREEIANG